MPSKRIKYLAINLTKKCETYILKTTKGCYGKNHKRLLGEARQDLNKGIPSL